MPPTLPMRRTLTAAAAATLLFTAAGTAAAAPAARHVPPAPSPAVTLHAPSVASHHGGLRSLAALSAERLATGDLVAAAKWGTDSPIDDPAREQQVLDAVAEQARQLGADPGATVRVFRDQIEANKIVQRGLHRLWAADPTKAPTERPDLNEVRKEINRINTALVQALAATPQARSAPSCHPRLTAAAVRVRHEHHLDTLALARSLRSVCATAD